MGFLDRLLGGDPGTTVVARRPAAAVGDERAVERYRYLLRTARPDEVEQVHAEAFARLTPAQRRRVYDVLSRWADPGDRPWSSEPDELASSATRSELRRAGFLGRSLGGGIGTAVAGSLLGTVAGFAIGSVVAETVLPGIADTASDVFEQVHDLGAPATARATEAAAALADPFGEWGPLGDLQF